MNDFYINFWSNLLSSLLADGLFVGIGLLYIERKLAKSDEEKRQKVKDKRMTENLKREVDMIWLEIEYNKIQLQLLIKSLKKRPNPDLIYPALESATWENINRQHLFEGLNSDEYADLIAIYNRIRTVNKLYEVMIVKINWILEGKKSVVKEEYVDALIDRCQELLNFINEVASSKTK